MKCHIPEYPQCPEITAFVGIPHLNQIHFYPLSAAVGCHYGPTVMKIYSMWGLAYKQMVHSR
jgi:hypothetical protein